ncbi:hypothetical protein ACFQT0_16320 [Hymenobacter humi]|uniref:Uncharacterized protein n=1 Tax=Hymenobacter humi TaxID=1411620 RepID=A0ABW2U7F6_9BACT
MAWSKRIPAASLDIRTKAVGVFRINKFYRQAPGKLYAGGQVEDVVQDDEADPMLRDIITKQVRQLYEALGLRKLLLELAPDYCIFDVAHHIGFSTEQEYQPAGHHQRARTPGNGARAPRHNPPRSARNRATQGTGAAQRPLQKPHAA